MSLTQLSARIQDKSAHLAVIGLGYVGLPVATMFAKVGFDVLGVEIKEDRVAIINAGHNPIEGEEPGLTELITQSVKSGKLRATSEYEDLKDRDVILIDVETPVNDSHFPEYDALRNALIAIGPVLKKNALVIIESTIAPNTMRDLVCPLLEQTSGKKVNRDFYLGNCPERVMPGKLLMNLQKISRVVGGSTPETSQVMITLYRHIVQADLDATDWITAELVKTVENSYRDVQIAFANEVALICEAVGANVWQVRDLVNKSPNRQMHLPGAGVGGHCIPKDPWLLVNAVKDTQIPIKLITDARMINDSMPHHMLELIKQGLEKVDIELCNARVLVLGYAYLENTDDLRNTPAEMLVQELEKSDAQVCIHDPYLAKYRGDVLLKARGCHVMVLITAHNEYRTIDLNKIKSVMAAPVLVDGRNLFDKQTAISSGFIYLRVGDGTQK